MTAPEIHFDASWKICRLGAIDKHFSSQSVVIIFNDSFTKTLLYQILQQSLNVTTLSFRFPLQYFMTEVF